MCNFLQMRPVRKVAALIEFFSQLFGFLFCLLGVINEASLIGGIYLLATSYLFRILTWQGDKYGIWYDMEIGN